MDVKPDDFFIGITELFAIILPGVVMLVVIYCLGERRYSNRIMAIPNDVHRLLAILVAAYVVGHFMSGVAAQLNNLYKKAYRPYTAAKDYNAVVDKDLVQYLGSAYVHTGGNGDKAQQWARSVLLVSNHEASEDIAQTEADAKFFRSLVFVLAVAVLGTAIRRRWRTCLICTLLLLLSLFRFFDLQSNREIKIYEHYLSVRAEAQSTHP